MKKVCMLAITVMIALTASAQSSSLFSSERSDQSITFGLRTGINFANLAGNGTDELDSRTGVHVGLSVDVPILESLYMQTGAYFVTKGWKYEESESGYTYKDKAAPLYFQVPILASYRYNFSESMQLQLNIGPYLAYGLGGKVDEEYSDDEDSESDSYDYFGDEDDTYGAKRFDAGLVLGAGMTFDKFYVGLQYEKGFSKVFKEGKAKNQNIALSVGYTF